MSDEPKLNIIEWDMMVSIYLNYHRNNQAIEF